MINIIFLALLVLFVTAERTADRVKKLPDFPESLLKSEWYSGYYNVSNNKHLHYLFVRSMHLPKTDPVILYFSGGPGFFTIPLAFMGLSPIKSKFTDDGKLDFQ